MEFKETKNSCLNRSTLMIISVLIFLRFSLSNRLPIYLLPDMPHDDGWVFARALSILKGEWLGTYNQLTLIKGPFSAIFLALSAGIGVSFSWLNTAFYSLACIIFLLSVRSIIRNKYLQLIFFALLLFNPISYALLTSQRIYRIGMGQWEILLIFGCLISLFLRRNENWRTLFKWGVGAGIALGVFSLTREDSVWIYPFVIAIIFCTVTISFLEEREFNKKIFIFLSPIIFACCLNFTFAIINYYKYGSAIVNDRSGGNFAKVARDLYLISPNSEQDKLYKSKEFKDHYYNIYLSTLENAFNFSPALKSARLPIMDAIKAWGNLEEIKNGELSTDHMLFALRDGLESAGYYHSLPETEKFLAQIHQELQAAFNKGDIVKRGFSISPLIKPVQMEDIIKAFSIMPNAIKDISEFRDVSSSGVASIGSEFNIKKLGLLAGADFFISPGSLQGSGWAFAHDNKTQLVASLYDSKGSKISDISFQGGQDVHDHMLSKGFNYSNAKNSRFSFQINGFDLKSGVKVRFYDTHRNFFREIPLNVSSICDEDDSFSYCIDDLKGDFYESFYARFVDRANHIIDLYKKIIPFFFVLGCFSYFAATIILIREFYLKQKLKTLPEWIVMTGVASSLVIFVFSMCIVTVTSFNALVYWYMAPSYLLLLIFSGVSVFWGFQTLYDFTRLKFQ